MVKIYVKNKDLGFWTEQAVTTQRFDGEELIYCDHKGAVNEEVENNIQNPNGADHVWYTQVLVCDKCDAYQIDGDWECAPMEGEH